MHFIQCCSFVLDSELCMLFVKVTSKLFVTLSCILLHVWINVTYAWILCQEGHTVDADVLCHLFQCLMRVKNCDVTTCKLCLN